MGLSHHNYSGSVVSGAIFIYNCYELDFELIPVVLDQVRGKVPV